MSVVKSPAGIRSAIGYVWDLRCGTQRNELMCETCATLTDLCEELGIDPPEPSPEADE